MVFYIYFHIMCVHVSICTPTLFGKWGFIWDVFVIVLYPLDSPLEDKCFTQLLSIIQKNLFNKFKGTFFCCCCFYCSHLDGLKLPHAEKNKVKMLTLNLSWPKISFWVDLGLNGHLCLGLLYLSKVLWVLEFSLPLFPKPRPQFPLASHHTHTPHPGGQVQSG